MAVVLGAPPATTTLDVAETLDVPDWLGYRGGDCRAYDRRSESEVYGPSRPFARCTDLVLTNGLVSLGVGNRLAVPFLNVAAFAGGRWHQSGCLQLDNDGSPNVLLGARLLRVTPDAATAVLTQRNTGDIFVTIRRGQRAVWITHGDGSTSATRHVTWRGTPPATVGATQGTGRFERGLSQLAGDTPATLDWPSEATTTEWTVAYRWLPAAASGSQGFSSLAGIRDTVGVRAVTSRWDNADAKAKLTIGGTTLVSGALSFAANASVFLAMRLSADGGTVLSTATPANPLAHVRSGSVDPGTVLGYDFVEFTASLGTAYGAGAYGAGPYGGIVMPGGVIDNVMLFRRALSDAQVAGLASAGSGLGNIAGFESNLVAYFPFDERPIIPNASSFYLSTEPSPGNDGLYRTVVGLAAAAKEPSGVGATATGSAPVFCAALVDGSAGDTATTHQHLLAAAYDQEVRTR